MSKIFCKPKFSLCALIVLVSIVPIAIAASFGVFGGVVRLATVGTSIVASIILVMHANANVSMWFFSQLGDSMMMMPTWVQRSLCIGVILILMAFSFLCGRFSMQPKVERLTTERRQLSGENFQLYETAEELKTRNFKLKCLFEQFRPLEEGMKADALRQ